MVSNWGIEINPNKFKAIEDITVVDIVKVVQRLTGRIATLGRFISRSSDQHHRFFSMLKKKNNFTWSSKCQQTLEELKRYLSSPPLLHTLKADEQLYLYLAVSEVAHVPREKNSEADALANLGSSIKDDEISSGTVVQLSKSVVEEGHAEINSSSLTWNWRNKYIDYLKNGKLPSDPKVSRTLRTKVARFTLAEDGTLYRRMFDGSLAICLVPGDTDYVLREIHEGTYGKHSGAESLVHKVIRAGYYWDNMEKDTKEFVRKYEKYQRHPPMIHQPGE
uniref:Uncharacterized protein LOC104215755 n=1 Tax=Nicotiana sylvestris TaxID=4096 RepID=A0A1U7VNL4_NICSY|nr:PREDICTED: uncharacterized protein LOC104215755 [Nicotiana sylvestris]